MVISLTRPSDLLTPIPKVTKIDLFFGLRQLEYIPQSLNLVLKLATRNRLISFWQIRPLACS